MALQAHKMQLPSQLCTQTHKLTNTCTHKLAYCLILPEEHRKNGRETAKNPEKKKKKPKIINDYSANCNDVVSNEMQSVQYHIHYNSIHV